MCHNFLENLLIRYVNITTTDLEVNNQWMNDPIEASLMIGNYFEHVKYCTLYVDIRKTPYRVVQVLHSAHHVVPAQVFYVDAYKKWIKNSANEQTWIGFNMFL